VTINANHEARDSDANLAIDAVSTVENSDSDTSTDDADNVLEDQEMFQQFHQISIFSSQCIGSVCNEQLKTISIHCKTCSKTPYAKMCLKCFLNGNHDHHDYQVLHTPGGICVCGNRTYMHPSSFCCSHSAGDELQAFLGRFDLTRSDAGHTISQNILLQTQLHQTTITNRVQQLIIDLYDQWRVT
jgi:hypothetical protein